MATEEVCAKSSTAFTDIATSHEVFSGPLGESRAHQHFVLCLTRALDPTPSPALRTSRRSSLRPSKTPNRSVADNEDLGRRRNLWFETRTNIDGAEPCRAYREAEIFKRSRRRWSCRFLARQTSTVRRASIVGMGEAVGRARKYTF